MDIVVLKEFLLWTKEMLILMLSNETETGIILNMTCNAIQPSLVSSAS